MPANPLPRRTPGHGLSLRSILVLLLLGLAFAGMAPAGLDGARACLR